MRPIDFFADRLDQIFEQGMPTKAQIYDAFHKANDKSVTIKAKSLYKPDTDEWYHFYDDEWYTSSLPDLLPETASLEEWDKLVGESLAKKYPEDSKLMDIDIIVKI